MVVDQQDQAALAPRPARRSAAAAARTRCADAGAAAPASMSSTRPTGSVSAQAHAWCRRRASLLMLHLAAHQLGQAPADHQPQAGAAEAARGAALGLAEGLEQPRLLLRA